MNPSVDKAGLALNIDLELNDLDFELAKSVGEYFNLRVKKMDTILDEVIGAVKSWKSEAKKLGIPTAQILVMEPAFRTEL